VHTNPILLMRLAVLATVGGAGADELAVTTAPRMTGAPEIQSINDKMMVMMIQQTTTDRQSLELDSLQGVGVRPSSAKPS
jgi:hypothetical protein